MGESHCIFCLFQEIRLVGGTTFEGRVEINRNGRWEGICGIGFTRREGQIVCRQLGLGFVEWATRSYGYGKKSKAVIETSQCGD